jgi:hypothetical protein
VPIYIVHLSAQRALAGDAEARDRGLPAFAETCPQYLCCSEDALRGAADDPQGGAATCARRRCDRRITAITCGAGCATTICSASPPITVRSA